MLRSMMLSLLLMSLVSSVPATAEDAKPALTSPAAEIARQEGSPAASNPTVQKEAAAKGPPLDVTEESERKQRVRLALEAETQLEFPDNSLREVLDYLAQVHSIQILTEDAVQDQMERRCSLTVSGVTLQTALRLVLKDDLDYVVDEGLLTITTKSAARFRTETRLYNIQEFVNVGMTSDHIVEAVTFAIEADKTDLGGVVALKNVLIVIQNQRSQTRVLELLEGLRRAVAVQNGPAE